MVVHVSRVDEFTDFVADFELRLRESLIAACGSEIGRDAGADALIYGWEHWDRVSKMENPAGYLYMVGRSRGRKRLPKRRPIFDPVETARTPDVEPGLPVALAALSERQRTVVDEALFGSAEMRSVTVGGPGLVAVGEAFGAIDSPAVWTSVDGIAWSRVPHDDAVFGNAGMSSVTVGGPGLVAVGFDGHPHGLDDNAAVWTSVDGIVWSRVPHDEAVFGAQPPVEMRSIVAGGPGLVAVGARGITNTSNTSDVALWVAKLEN